MSNGVPPGVSLRSGNLTVAQLPAEAVVESETTAMGRALIAKTAVAITGDYSDGTVLASVVAALVSLGLCTDGTTA